MASKLNLMTFMQEVRGWARLNRRFPQSGKPQLLVPLRDSSPPTVRRSPGIPIDVKDLQETQYAVRITHVSAPAAAPSVAV